ncbi:peroxide stress protein YaaA [Clostridium sp. CCUG 7971]|uniref:peroxide stress protein YaaA n=1 Tax=Clostridium sp. CCUG 7971 TaxID=2811414 RepID=UPI001ABAAA3F|nr:peroxide stress protein YaaA [Clostridium sp. CCUG 7971]MBO3446204.1 peroxide stress protein YaaA [Clostridium sp. CCUG 7971]
MITIISPTTTMNFDKNIKLNKSSFPIFSDEVNYLIDLLKPLSSFDIKNLMNLSDELSNLNFNRYSSFNKSNNKTLQSILAFDGEVFNSMNASNFNDLDIDFANKYLRILSGLYGVLRPLDMIQPYRLEMKTKLENNCGKDLYKFWKSKITNHIMDELKNHDNSVLVNLASSEYIKCIDLKLLKQSYKFVDIVFKEYNPINDTYKVKGLYAKKARGYMVEYIVKNRVSDIEHLKLFNKEGYEFNPNLSNNEVFTFTR